VKKNRANEEKQQRIRHNGCGGVVASDGAILCENEGNRCSAVAAQIERQSHWNPSAAHKNPTGPGLGAHKEGTEASTVRERILQKKSDQQVRPAIWTKIKAKNTQKKFSDLVST
jgi:hypothetical protein